MPNPLRIQLALQGGGARIAVLMAAAEAVQELENERQVSVTRLAGTSAGAIVGAFLAAGKDISSLRARLSGDKGQALVSQFPKKSAVRMLLWDALRGAPFWKEAPLRAWLTKEFGDQTKLETLKKPLFVYSANLDAGGVETQVNGHVVTALLESAGLPFCFRTWKASGNTINVDGGLCENLPVRRLVNEADQHGRVVAFSFPIVGAGKPESLLKFGMSLLDVAINNSVETARERLGADSVCELKPPQDLTTFNFDRALQYLASNDYDETKKEVRAWFGAVIDSAASSSRVHFATNVWHKPAKDFRREMQKIGRVYRSQSAQERLHHPEVNFRVFANCLAERGQPGFGQPDEVFYELTLEPVNVPITSHHVTFSTPQTSDFFGRYSLKLISTSTGADAAFEAVASISPASETDREIVVFFCPPLKPGTGAYRLSLQDQGIELLAGLKDPDKRSDYLSINLARPTEPIERVHIAIEVPEQMAGVLVRGVGSAQSSIMTPAQLQDVFGKSPIGFRAFGWKGENIEPKTMVRVDFSV
jgi:NTE family protein